MVTYYGKAWIEACKDNLNKSEKHLKKGRKLNGTFDFRVWDGPDGKDRRVTWTFDAGKCTETTLECQVAPWKELREMPINESYVGRISAPFDMMVKLDKGEIGPLKAITSSDNQLEGKKTIIFQRMTAMNSWADHNAQIECNYEFTQTDDEGNEI